MQTLPLTYLIVAAAIATLLVALWLTRLFEPRRRRERALRRVVRRISKETLRDLVIPDGEDGEIVIDQVLLTAKGLLILEIKRVDGTVFGGERLDNWTAIAKNDRVVFPNPVALLQRRVIALKTLFRDVPVLGRVVFLGDVEFSKDLPADVTDASGLREEFGRLRSKAQRALIDAFYPHWNELRQSSAA